MCLSHTHFVGLLKNPRPCHCEKCGEVMQGVERDEAISIYALAMQARRLLRRPAVRDSSE